MPKSTGEPTTAAAMSDAADASTGAEAASDPAAAVGALSDTAGSPAPDSPTAGAAAADGAFEEGEGVPAAAASSQPEPTSASSSFGAAAATAAGVKGNGSPRPPADAAEGGDEADVRENAGAGAGADAAVPSLPTADDDDAAAAADDDDDQDAQDEDQDVIELEDDEEDEEDGGEGDDGEVLRWQPDLPAFLAQALPAHDDAPARALPPVAPGARASTWRGDLTALPACAIVNAANEGLWAGGGICGAIHAKAGPGLERECQRFAASAGVRCPTGEAVATRGGGRLAAPVVLHAVGPVYCEHTPQEARRLLAGCYTNSLDVAAELGLTSVAFPCISTGIFGFPALAAARTALAAVRGWLDARGAETDMHVVFCTFTPDDTAIYAREAPLAFAAPVE